MLLHLTVAGGGHRLIERLPMRVAVGLPTSFVAMEVRPVRNTPWRWFELDGGSTVGPLAPGVSG
jgi:hypothetical protein